MLIKSFYYFLYLFLLKIKTNDQPFTNAYIGISFFICLNILSIFGVLNNYFSYNLSKDSIILAAAFMYVGITILNYFTLYKKRKEIVSKFKNESISIKKRRKIIFSAYLILTLCIFIYISQNMVKEL